MEFSPWVLLGLLFLILFIILIVVIAVWSWPSSHSGGHDNHHSSTKHGHGSDCGCPSCSSSCHDGNGDHHSTHGSANNQHQPDHQQQQHAATQDGSQQNAGGNSSNTNNTTVSDGDEAPLTALDLELDDDFAVANGVHLESVSKYRSTHPHQPTTAVTGNKQQLAGNSFNWSGYAAANTMTKQPVSGSVTQAIGTWTVPKILPGAVNTWCSIWSGIDGFSNSTVQQIGTEHDWTNGVQQNYAWFEMYPAGAYEIVGFPLRVGDSITAQVSYVGNSTFRLVLINNTRRVYYVVPSRYTQNRNAKRTSAEVIVEAPYYQGILPLSHFQPPVQVSAVKATINGVTAPFNHTGWDYARLTMINSSNQVKATTSPLSSNGQNFSVTWQHE